MIKLPQSGPNVKSATIRKWLKKPGESVGKGDLIVQIETDAGIVDIESPVAGRLGKVLVADGATAAVHADLAMVETDSAPNNSPPPPPPLTPTTPKPAAPTGAGKATPILMPKAGQSMEEGTIIKWHVRVGDTVKQGQVIFEIETDKANMEVEAPAAGRVARILTAEGQSLAVQQPVAYLADSDAELDAFIAAHGGSTAAPAAAQPKAEAATITAAPTAAPAVSDGGRVKASPAARKIAQDRGIDLHTIPSGAGPGGRILSTDVPLEAAPATASTNRKRMSQMRRAIGRTLQQSKQTIPHFYVRLTVDAGPMLAFYQARKTQFPCSINDVIVQACGRLMKEFPAFRTRLEGDEIVETPGANIGIAVGLDDGLVVPVLSGAERMDLKQIAAETRRLATSARSGTIVGMGSGTFTITNLGMFGTEEFAAIINPPEAAILAVGAAREAVIVKDGAMRAGRLMTMTLSADHRVIDGLLAAKFLARMKEVLESPEKSLS
jgi:pyruvate dehydrogenase E2 component (dihydrolipoamide acetyltransferase)